MNEGKLREELVNKALKKGTEDFGSWPEKVRPYLRELYENPVPAVPAEPAPAVVDEKKPAELPPPPDPLDNAETIDKEVPDETIDEHTSVLEGLEVALEDIIANVEEMVLENNVTTAEPTVPFEKVENTPIHNLLGEAADLMRKLSGLKNQGRLSEYKSHFIRIEILLTREFSKLEAARDFSMNNEPDRKKYEAIISKTKTLLPNLRRELESLETTKE